MNNHNSTYSSINSNNHESDQSYNIYSPHSISYTDYPTTTTKLDVLDYNYWPTTTHNILTNSSNTMLDSIPTETHVPMPIVHLPPLNSSTAITATHHHHHIHQHLYPPVLPSSSPPCSDPSPWIGSTDYQLLHPSINSSSYPHYSTPCSYYHPTNQFYDSAQPQWTSSSPPPPPPSSSIRPIKFESPYTPPPSYFESSDSINHCHEQASEDEPSDSSTWSKLQPIIPPRNPLNGKTRTCDKYRIVYTEQQRIELEKEFMISKYISIPKKASLSLNLSLSERQIKIWFQNRRAKDRKLSKRRQTMSSNYQLNNSNDVDSPSDGDFENSTYYS